MERISDLDHSYIRTSDDVLFSVCGNSHTQQHIFGMPYYIPTQKLEAILSTQISESIVVDKEEFTKLLSQIPRSDYKNFIRENYPTYYYSPPMWEMLMRVDRSKMVKVFNPKSVVEESIKKLDVKNDQSGRAMKIISAIREFDEKLLPHIGFGGSVLLDTTTEEIANDIDMLVYGREAIPGVKKFVSYLLDTGVANTLHEDELKKYIESRKSQFSGNPEMTLKLFKDRWDVLFFDGIKVDLSFVSETGWCPVDSYMYEAGEKIVFQAKISGIEDSYYMPTVVKLADSKYEKLLITARGYICIFNVGQEVDITGIEHRSSVTGEKYVVIDESNGGYVQSV